MENDKPTNTWPDLAVGLFDKLTERKAEIIYEVENLVIQVPSKVGGEAGHANWKVDGVLKIRTNSNAH